MKIFYNLSVISFFFFNSLSFAEPIGVMVPYGAGGATDFQARIVTMPFENKNTFQRPAYILNKPGAGGKVGWSWYASLESEKSKDILVSYNVPHFIAQSIVMKTTYSTQTFEPLANWGADPAVLVVPKKSKINNISDFKSVIKNKEFICNGAGLYVGHHILALQIIKEFKKLKYVPHPTGGAGAMKSVMSNEIKCGFNNLSDAVRAERDGLVKILAVADVNRHEFLPQVPTFFESGFKFVDDSSVNFRGLAVRKGLDNSIINSYSKAAITAFSNKRVISKMTSTGSPMRILNREETINLWKRQEQSMKILLNELKK